METYIAALDQGTTSSRAILFNRAGEIVSRAQHPFRQIYPQPGWVEHDPLEIWATEKRALAEVVGAAHIDPKRIAALGITNQRETTILWDRSTGQPVCNAIVWQCRRTAPLCDTLKADGLGPLVAERTGLLIDAYFSGTKIRWLLDHVPGARERAERGELCAGTVDSWLIWNLTGGAAHVTDYSNASRTMLFNIHTLQWDEALCRALGIPASLLPEPLPNCHLYGRVAPDIPGLEDLAGIPIHSAERTGLTPLVIAGGTAMYNAEPIADFIDLVSLGEGEDITVELVELHRKARREGWSKMQFLRAAAQLPGIYVPSLYEVTYHDDGTVAEITPLEGAPAVVTKRIVHDMDKSFFPTQTIVPSTEIVQDRVMLELFRGCIRGCRFCQAGYVYRPVRNRSEALCAQYAVESCDGSGYQEVTLSSLSTSDYPPLTQLCDQLEDFCQQRHVNLSLPSLRADNFSMNLMERLAKGRKSGLTFAPEAGTQRLRDVINKNVTQEDLLQSCRTAFAGGYNAVKLYFMLGLPTETDEDVLGIADLAARVMHTWRESASNKNRGVRITVSTSWFVPKPHTAFQWEPQISKEEYERRVALLREAIKTKTVTYNWHDSDTSFLEAVLARGDRRMCKVLETAWRKGSKLDAWEEYFSLDRWLEAFEECGLDPHFYANRTRSLDEKMPWDMISSGVTTAYLRRERERAFAGVTTPDCRTHCNGCGANRLVGGKCDV